MKSYAKQATAAGQATKLTKTTGIKHVFAQDGASWAVGTEAEIDEAFNRVKQTPVKQTKLEGVEVFFHGAKVEGKYIVVEVEGKTFKIGTRMVSFKQAETGVKVVMSRKYMAHRPELKLVA